MNLNRQYISDLLKMNFAEYNHVKKKIMLDDVHGVLSDDLDSLPHFQIIRKDLTDEFKKLR
jgi:hypothetical protein